MNIVHIGVTLDCIDPQSLAGFWAQALDMSVDDEGDYVLLRNRLRRTGMQGFTLQRVPESKVVKNRMHFDVVVSHVTVEVDRLQLLGAQVLQIEQEPTPFETVVMADPAGNEFCVIKAQP